MGTNYYLELPEAAPCPACGHAKEAVLLHLGKSSAGWCFALHFIPGVAENLEQWKTLMRLPGACIRDEYGDKVDSDAMLLVITGRYGRPGLGADFDFARNRAVPGPCGLVRTQLDGQRCVAHGAGTWDMIAGDYA